MKLDNTKVYKFRKTLLQKHWNKPIEQWADIIDGRVVKPSPDNKNLVWRGNVIYSVQGNKVQIPEQYTLEVDWCEEVIDEKS